MPKTKRDVMKRRCDQMLKHTAIINYHLNQIYKPYQNRPNTRAYPILTEVYYDLEDIENKIQELRCEL